MILEHEFPVLLPGPKMVGVNHYIRFLKTAGASIPYTFAPGAA
jgi:hypothetical protein